MSFRADLQTATAALVADVHGTLGESVTYSNRGATGVTLTAWPGTESQDLAQELGCDVNATARRFEIGKQTNFPPSAGVSVSDEVTFSSVVYRVVKWADISGGMGALFQLDCVRYQARRAGV